MILPFRDLIGQGTDYIRPDVTDLGSDNQIKKQKTLLIHSRQHQKRNHKQKENRRRIHDLFQNVQPISGTKQLNPQADTEKDYNSNHEQNRIDWVHFFIKQSEHGKQHGKPRPNGIRRHFLFFNHSAELINGPQHTGNRQNSKTEFPADSIPEDSRCKQSQQNDRTAQSLHKHNLYFLPPNRRSRFEYDSIAFRNSSRSKSGQ